MAWSHCSYTGDHAACLRVPRNGVRNTVQQWQEEGEMEHKLTLSLYTERHVARGTVYGSGFE